jgi:hypothetical protein
LGAFSAGVSPTRADVSLFRFAFYRDSFRFIGVLAMVAVCGFLASSVNFIKLGVSAFYGTHSGRHLTHLLL